MPGNGSISRGSVQYLEGKSVWLDEYVVSPFSLPVDDSLLDCPHRYSYESFLRVHFFHVFGGLCGLRRSGNPPVA